MGEAKICREAISNNKESYLVKSGRIRRLLNELVPKLTLSLEAAARR